MRKNKNKTGAFGGSISGKKKTVSVVVDSGMFNRSRKVRRVAVVASAKYKGTVGAKLLKRFKGA